MSTPYLDEAERCSRVALMHKGKIISLDTPPRIKESIRVEIAEIVCSRVRDANKLVKENLNNEVQLFGDRINVVLDKGNNNLKQVLQLLKDNSIEVISYRIVPPSLENVFIHYVEADAGKN
jgi:ABC-2 type transport system ATP-binding protein